MICVLSFSLGEMNQFLPAKIIKINEDLKKEVAGEIVAGKIQTKTGFKIINELYDQVKPELKGIIDQNYKSKLSTFTLNECFDL